MHTSGTTMVSDVDTYIAVKTSAYPTMNEATKIPRVLSNPPIMQTASALRRISYPASTEIGPERQDQDRRQGAHH